MVWGKLILKASAKATNKEVSIDDFRIANGAIEVLLAFTRDERSFDLADVDSVLKGSPDGNEKKLNKRDGVSGLT